MRSSLKSRWRRWKKGEWQNGMPEFKYFLKWIHHYSNVSKLLNLTLSDDDYIPIKKRLISSKTAHFLVRIKKQYKFKKVTTMKHNPIPTYGKTKKETGTRSGVVHKIRYST